MYPSPPYPQLFPLRDRPSEASQASPWARRDRPPGRSTQDGRRAPRRHRCTRAQKTAVASIRPRAGATGICGFLQQVGQP